MRIIKTLLEVTKQLARLAVMYAELAGRVSALEAGKPAAEPTEPDDAEKKFQKGLESILNYGVKKPEVNDEEVE
uniref:Uncharacterized protein n=1 Tax=Myoviridae sp. ctuIn11 TaxID=2827715 RepID=A0A8S5SHI5_9CAUD|nr:MAG TPA: hypothetical protein [Myoviridae sp. ctuIn11]